MSEQKRIDEFLALFTGALIRAAVRSDTFVVVERRQFPPDRFALKLDNGQCFEVNVKPVEELPAW